MLAQKLCIHLEFFSCSRSTWYHHLRPIDTVDLQSRSRSLGDFPLARACSILPVLSMRYNSQKRVELRYAEGRSFNDRWSANRLNQNSKLNLLQWHMCIHPQGCKTCGSKRSHCVRGRTYFASSLCKSTQNSRRIGSNYVPRTVARLKPTRKCRTLSKRSIVGK